MAEIEAAPDVVEETPALLALTRNVQSTFSSIVDGVPYLPEELQIAIANVDDPSALSHLIAGSLRLKTEEKQALLVEVDVGEAAAAPLRDPRPGARGDLDRLQIQSQVQSELGASQREYFLRQQLKAIQEELGEEDETEVEVRELREQLGAIELPVDVRRQVDRELGRLTRLPPAAAEHGVIRSYLEWIASLPWDRATVDNLDLVHARAVLDEDHYDIDRVRSGSSSSSPSASSSPTRGG